NRVLILAADQATGESVQQALSESGFHTALVWDGAQMVEFCRQHSPDGIVVDVDAADPALWTSVQAVRGLGSLANVSFFGLATDRNGANAKMATEAGFTCVVPRQDGPVTLIGVLLSAQGSGSLNSEAPASVETVTGRDPSLNRLRDMVGDMIVISGELEERLSEFGGEGPELFGYISSSGTGLRDKLDEIADFSLHDRDLRHDLRNMIGPITGFAELILMEPGLSDYSAERFRQLRKMAAEFVEILDHQKAEAAA
ncbi:MAG: hypothetical protein AAF236_17565, partial [Verrucomicrobiota bacterium]